VQTRRSSSACLHKIGNSSTDELSGVSSTYVSNRNAIRAVVRISRLLERACGDLSLAHYRVLAAVAEGEERASRIAERLALGKPTVSASVDALCRRGLLMRDSAAGDQRVSPLHLTADGEATLRAVEEAMLERFAAVLAHTREASDVVSALNRLGTGLDDLATARRASRV
jgi:DNA-binding MarR family transcriptional regulator